VPKYPNIEVELSGQDGNGFFIVARVTSALKQAHVPIEEVNAYVNEAMSDDYNHLIQTTMDMVSVS
jgi:glycine cleavage system regulatory protein